MTNDRRLKDRGQLAAEQQVEEFRHALGPFVVAAETTRMPMIFLRADEGDHSIVYANDSFLSLTGFGMSEVIGKPFNFFFANKQTGKTLITEASANAAGHGDSSCHACRRADGTMFNAAIFISQVLG